MSKCDCLPSEDIRVTTNWICCSGAYDGGAICKGCTNIKEGKVSEFLSGNWKTNNVHGNGQDLEPPKKP